jgi:diaminohydroxyphosphoribosylaminopyrimidine deaminase/5-amino-6-(5-phosphoribosylamino)uracil reductase
MDALLVGTGTVRADNPLLTARPPGPRTPVRIVLSGSGTLPVSSRLLQTLGEAPVSVATLEGKGRELREAGCEVIALPEENGRPSVRALLTELGRRRFTNVMVEGGAGVFGSLCDERLIDELHVFVAPRLIGGAAAPSPVGGLGAPDMAGAWPLLRWTQRPVGPDIYLRGWTRRPTDSEQTP